MPKLMHLRFMNPVSIYYIWKESDLQLQIYGMYEQSSKKKMQTPTLKTDKFNDRKTKM